VTLIRARRYRILTAASAALALLLSHSTLAMAAWSTPASGSAAGAAATMPSGGAPSGGAIGTSVTLTWATAHLSSGTAVAGYVIRKYNAANGTPVAVGSGCSGVITTLTCTELGVAAGTWFYTVTPVQMNWTGGESAGSSTITVA
jgi:hypothetical protein